MKYYANALTALLLIGLVHTAQAQNLVAAEYYFNTDPGPGHGTPISISAASSVSTTFTIPSTGLPVGFQQLFIRFKDARNQWGIATQRSVYVNASAPGPPAAVANGEYFIDIDPGPGKAHAIATGINDTVNTAISINAGTLTTGFHQLFVRFKDTLDNWGIALGRTFYINGSAPAAPPALTNAEYFIDVDPGTGKAHVISISKADTVNTALSISAGSLKSGFHQLFIRFKDTLDNWGLAYSRYFYFDSSQSPAKLAPIIAAEYFIKKDSGIGKGKPIPIVKADTLNQLFTLGVSSGLPLGNTTINVRFKDSAGQWGLATPRTITIVCKPNLGKDTTVKICAGSYTDITGLYSYKGYAASQWSTKRPDSVGLGTDTLIVTSSLGCKDTAVVTVLPYPKPNLGKDTTVYTCLGTAINIKTLYNTTGYTTVTWATPRPDSITAKGFYALVVANSNGCKDTAVVTVSNYPKPNLGKDTTVYTCPGAAINIKSVYTTTGFTTIVWSTERPDSITATGAYTLIVTNSNGCADTAVVTVSNYTKPNLGKDTSVYTCPGTPLNIKNVYGTTGYSTIIWSIPRPDSVTVTGTYTIIVANSNGCRDTAAVVVGNYPKPNLGKDTSVALCPGAFTNIANLYNTGGYKSVKWNIGRPDSVYAGTYTLFVTNSNGCMDTAVVKVANAALPAVAAITHTGSTSFCLYDSIILTANAASGNLLQWYRNNTAVKLAVTNKYVVRLGGSYKLKVTNSGGCSVMSDSLLVTVTQVPTPIINLVNDTLVSSATTGNQWFEDGVPIPGATGNKYPPVDIDVYTVQVTSGSCKSQMSTQFIYMAGTFMVKGRVDNNSNVFALISPNPAKDAAILRLSGFTGGITVTITDMAGRIVWKQGNIVNSTHNLPLSNLMAGTYIVTIKDKKNIRSLKLIKAQ